MIEQQYPTDFANPDRADGTRYLRVPDEQHHLFALRPGGVVEHFDICHGGWHPAPVEVLQEVVAAFGAMTEVAYTDLPAGAR
jgi:hypothetical protein